ncbi:MULTISPECIES: DUF4357 domain-containing protein [Peribacillus]|uniref:DUF4357 domain-containing protein n=1 Tax=Peribacillus TaxID=2675229 RepID=UPI000BA60125|nr:MULTISPECIES: DUF4357 domain-containing protein [Peribacillus]MCY9139688.1 DUF4357 domain-containing protein [Peribacillus frigoritolerans]PAK34478.1 hypothetical protein CHI08_25490 [Peribacillus simplex]
MKKTLSAEEMPLYKVFSDDYLFTIPTVQRPYSWTLDEAGDLLDDLLDFIEQQSITEENISQVDEPYFLGSIVLVKKERNQAEVLDGQQRLTTLTILLGVLRDYLGEEYARNIKVLIAQEGNRLLQTKEQYRIQLRKRDQSFFQQYIQEDGATTKIKDDTVTKTDSQKCIRENALYFINRLNNLEPSVVRALPGVIAGLCYIVVVSTPNFDSAFRIFTVLNDRGLDLMSSDIIKARAIGDVPEIEQDDYTMKWEEVEVALGRNRFNKLFEHIRMIIQKRKGGVNLKDEYDEIFSEMDGKCFIDDFLIPYSEIYLKLVDYQTYYHENPQMMKLLSVMSRIDNADWITVAMYYIYYHEERVEAFLNRLETFAATSMIMRRNFNWRISKYSAVLREMDKGIDVFSELSTLEVTDNDRKNILSQLNGDVYTDLKDTARRYILLRLDSLLTRGQPYYSHSVITVEHVLPQTPKEGSEWFENFEQPEEYVHKLGNLVLLTRSKNSQAKNYDFQKKKKSYFQSSGGVTSFALTSQVIQMTKWTPAIVEKRQKQLVQLLVKTWELDKKTSKLSTQQVFYIQTEKGVSAAGYPTEQGFLVERGAKFSSSLGVSLIPGYVELRRKLIDQNILILQGDYYILRENYVFSSPTTASSLLYGRSANGYTDWKLSNGRTLKEIVGE